jgi:hypothetical protein
MLIHIAIEVPFSPTFDSFSIALVFWNVGNHSTIPQHLSCFPDIKTTIRIEEGTVVLQPKAFQIGEDILELLMKVITVIMLTSNNPSCGDNVTVGICYR